MLKPNERELVETIESLLGIIYEGRPIDPRDSSKWTTKTVRAERKVLAWRRATEADAGESS